MKAISSLGELHAVELDILLDIHRFCIAERIQYSLAGGTLLGAIRHKGFIPWDDDVDVMMPRPDYERFVRSYSSRFYALHEPRVHPRAFRPFAKVVDTRTVLPDDDFCGERPGVWVDVFPIDGAASREFFPPNDSRTWKVFSAVLLAKNLRLFSRKRGIAKNALLLAMSPVRFLPNRLFAEVLQRIAARDPFETSPFRGCRVWGYGRRETLPAAVFSGQIDVPFEGCLFRAIAGWREYLTANYGDFMQLPPPEKRSSSHDLNAFWKDGFER